MKSKLTNQFDLHLHSYYSDGADSPGAVLRRARQAKFTLAAIADHNTIEHVPFAKKAAKKLKLPTVAAAEISVSYQKKQLHLLALGFDEKKSEITKFFKSVQSKRRREIFVSTKKLRRLGFVIADQELKKIRPDYWEFSNVIKLLLKNQINKKKIKAEIGDLNVFNIINHYFTAGKPAYVKEVFPPAVKVIKLVRRNGGVAVLAHPGYHLQFQEDELIQKLSRAGLWGLEVFTPKHNWQQTVHYELLAKKLKLVITAGSDYHAEIHKNNIPLGTPIGLLRLPARVYINFLTAFKKQNINAIQT